MKNRTRLLTRYALLVAVTVTVSYIEYLVPPFFAIPGMKLGLSNAVVLYALYCMGDKSGLLVNGIRIFLVAILFGNGIGWAYGLVGGLFSGIGMLLLKKSGYFHIVTVSIVGGVLHNIGQILVATVLLGTKQILWYLLILWFTGILSGALIGFLSGELVRRLSRFGTREVALTHENQNRKI